jgi:hypothetical protein
LFQIRKKKDNVLQHLLILLEVSDGRNFHVIVIEGLKENAAMEQQYEIMVTRERELLDKGDTRI